MDQTFQEIADYAASTQTDKMPLRMISDFTNHIEERDAYQTQALVIRQLVERGRMTVGHKIAATSEAAQQSLGLNAPAYGVLFEDFEITNGGTVSVGELIAPRLECEIAFFLKEDLEGPGVTPEDVLAATEAVAPALELVDLRTPQTEGWQTGRGEVICYNAFASGFVIGSERVAPADIDLTTLTCVLSRNGEEISRGTGSAVLGNPLFAMEWLANKMGENGYRLKAGEVIITGTITPPLEVEPGDTYEASFEGLGSVSLSFGE